MIFPVRNIGVTKYCSATFRAVLRPNGKVFVKYTSVKVFQCDMFKEEVKTLGSYSQAREGFEFDPDDIVFIKLYDQGGGTVPIPALALIDFSNQIQESTLNTATTAFVLGLTLGMGGLGGAGVKGFGGRALLWADRVAWAIPAISMAVNGASRLGAQDVSQRAGPVSWVPLQKANQIAGYYGCGPLGLDGVRFVKSKLHSGMGGVARGTRGRERTSALPIKSLSRLWMIRLRGS